MIRKRQPRSDDDSSSTSESPSEGRRYSAALHANRTAVCVAFLFGLTLLLVLVAWPLPPSEVRSQTDVVKEIQPPPATAMRSLLPPIESVSAPSVPTIPAAKLKTVVPRARGFTKAPSQSAPEDSARRACIATRIRQGFKVEPQLTLVPTPPAFYAARRMENIDAMLGTTDRRRQFRKMVVFLRAAEANASSGAPVSRRVLVVNDRVTDAVGDAASDDGWSSFPLRLSLDLSKCALSTLVERADFLDSVLVPIVAAVLESGEIDEKLRRSMWHLAKRLRGERLAQALLAQHLATLDLGSNRIAALAANFHEMFPALEILFLSNNVIRVVPPSLARFSRLTRLSLKGNKLESIDPSNEFPPTIEHLILTDNAISSIRSSFCDVVEGKGEPFDELRNFAEPIGAAEEGMSALRPSLGLSRSFGRLRKLMLAGNHLTSIVPLLHPHDVERFHTTSGRWRVAFLNFLQDVHWRNGLFSAARPDGTAVNVTSALLQLQRVFAAHDGRRLSEQEGADIESARVVGVPVAAEAAAAAAGIHIPPYCAIESLELLRVTRNDIRSIDLSTRPHGDAMNHRQGGDAGHPDEVAAERAGSSDAADDAHARTWAQNSAALGLRSSGTTDRELLGQCQRLAWVSFAGNPAASANRLAEDLRLEAEHRLSDARGRDAGRGDSDSHGANEEVRVPIEGQVANPRDGATSRSQTALPNLSRYLSCTERPEATAEAMERQDVLKSGATALIGEGTSGVVKRCVLHVPGIDDGAFDAEFEDRMAHAADSVGAPRLDSRQMYVAVKFFKRVSSDGSADDERSVLSMLRQHPHVIAPLGVADVTLRDDAEWKSMFPDRLVPAMLAGMDFDAQNRTVVVVFPFVSGLHPLALAPDIVTVTDGRYPAPLGGAPIAESTGRSRRYEFDFDRIASRTTSQKVAGAVALRIAITRWVASQQPTQAALRHLRFLPEISALNLREASAHGSALFAPVYDALHAIPPWGGTGDGAEVMGDNDGSSDTTLAVSASAPPTADAASFCDLVDKFVYVRLVVTLKLLLDVADALAFLHYRLVPIRNIIKTGTLPPLFSAGAAQQPSIAHGDLYAHNLFFAPPPAVHPAVARMNELSATSDAAQNPEAASTASADVVAGASDARKQLHEASLADQRLRQMLAGTPWAHHEGLLTDFGASFAYRRRPESAGVGGPNTAAAAGRSNRSATVNSGAIEKLEVRAFGHLAQEMFEHVVGFDLLALGAAACEQGFGRDDGKEEPMERPLHHVAQALRMSRELIFSATQLEASQRPTFVQVMEELSKITVLL